MMALRAQQPGTSKAKSASDPLLASSSAKGGELEVLPDAIEIRYPTLEHAGRVWRHSMSVLPADRQRANVFVEMLPESLASSGYAMPRPADGLHRTRA